MNNPYEALTIPMAHRTIREFKDEKVSDETFAQLMEVARRTATSNGMQQFSIIRVTDPSMKKEISEICKQGYIQRAPELLIFLADQYRNARIAEEKNGSRELTYDMDRFFQGFTDACIAAQNVVNAAEALGMGAMYLGSIHNDSEAICRILGLPELTFPVVGLGLGYPNQSPQIKPRMDNHLKVFENRYRVFDDYLEEIKEYDEELQTYYDLRNANRRVDSFSDQVVAKMSAIIAKRQDILKAIFKQGFKE